MIYPKIYGKKYLFRVNNGLPNINLILLFSA